MLVLQSYRSHDVPAWLEACMASVREWAQNLGCSYHCADDEELLGSLPGEFKSKLDGRWPMLADLGRLKLMQSALAAGESRVLWLDADVLVFAPEKLAVPTSLRDGYAFGRELWVDERGRVHHGVHNALCVFDSGNPFLDYYIHACERIVEQHSGGHWAPQLLGPKFLKMQNNLMQFELLDSVAMLSPSVLEDIVRGGGPILNKQSDLLGGTFGAANLCSSLIDDASAMQAIEKLREMGNE